MGDLYSAADVINKTLIAKQPITIYKTVPKYLPPGKKMSDYKVGVVPAGSWVGVVDSYITPDAGKGQPNLWWQFYPANNFSSLYFAEHTPGAYDVNALRQQGTLSVQEKVEEEANKDKSLLEKLGGSLLKTIATLGFVGLGIYAVSTVIKSSKDGKN